MLVIVVSRFAAALALLAFAQACSHEINGPGSSDTPSQVPRPAMDPGVHPLPNVEPWRLHGGFTLPA